MKTKKRVMLAIPLFVFTLQAEGSQEWQLKPRIEYGIIDYNLEFSGQLPTPSGGFIEAKNKFSLDLQAIRIGLTGVVDRIFIDTYYQTTNEASDISSFPEFNYLEKFSGDRDEFSAAIGYAILDSFSVFGGYRYSKLSADGNIGSTYEFKHDGFFLGAAYGVPIGDAGVLAVNAAYAFLDAELDETLVGNHVPASGDGNGFKIGVSWNGKLSEVVGYNISVDYYDYNYDLENKSIGVNADMEESEVGIRIGLSYEF